MFQASESHREPVLQGTGDTNRFMLWIDGVGAYLLCLSQRVTIGGPMFGSDSADIALLANLSRKHATLVRTREGYLIEAHAPVKVGGRTLADRSHLKSNYEIELAGRVKMHFRTPSVLSASAVLDFLSDHRPSQHVDGVILMDETCLLGPGTENHVRCPGWSESVLLFRKGNQFWCKSALDIFVDGRLCSHGGPIAPGEVVSGPDLRFRIEAVD